MRLRVLQREAPLTRMKSPEQIDLARALQVSVSAAQACTQLMTTGLGRPRDIRSKGDASDLVTDVDHAAEAIILDHLLSAYPAFSVLSEEAGETRRDSNWTWIVDPLDGTTNFIRGVPHVSISIALAYREQPRVACIHDPLRQETFTAVRGAGARMNGVSIDVSDRASLAGAVVAVGFSKIRERAVQMLEGTRALLDSSCALRTTGSACLDLAYAACGRADAVWYGGLSTWDVAAGMLLVSEAGGRVTNPAGAALENPETGVIASNCPLHPEIVRIIGGRG